MTRLPIPTDRMPGSIGAERKPGCYRGNSPGHASAGDGIARDLNLGGGAMEVASINGVELEYEVTGSGEPLLLISPVIADGFLPLVAEPALADRFRLIRYHKRGWSGSTRTSGPVSVDDHAADAVALLDALGVDVAHVAGHSSGAAVAAQMA